MPGRRLNSSLPPDRAEPPLSSLPCPSMLQAVRYLLGSPGATGFGSKSTAEDVTAACPDLAALTAIITGATSGIGAETARVLAKRGARVVIPARSVNGQGLPPSPPTTAVTSRPSPPHRRPPLLLGPVVLACPGARHATPAPS